MNISKPYKIALLVGTFITFAIIGFWFESSGLLEGYLENAAPAVAIIAGSFAIIFTAYVIKQKNQSSDC